MLGYETEYDSKAEDNSLLRISQTPETILLTRDEEMYNRALGKNIHSILVLGVKEETRLAQLARTLGISLEIDMDLTRCPECGSRLHLISREEASSAVPAKSLELYDPFWKCNRAGCGKTYWVGSHWKQIRHTLEEARKIASLEEKDMKC